MQKKSAIIALAAILILACALAAGCQQKEVTSIDFKEGTYSTEYVLGDTVDYSAIKITVTYSDNSKEELSLTDKGVTYTPIDTSKLSSSGVNFTVTYGGKSKTLVVRVMQKDVDDMTVTKFSYAEGYQSYLNNKKEQTNKQNEFADRGVNYLVGTDNAFVFIPDTIASDLTGSYANEKVKTTSKIFSVGESGAEEELTGTDLTAVISKIENNMYWFTPEAEGEVFRLEISLDDKYETILSEENKTISITVEVCKGYNAYDAYGFSVLDNLNVKSWSDIKDRQLDWDTKKLSEYTDVEKVILHNNIVIKKDYLPANYFWTEGETALPGGGVSYSDAYNSINENYQKGGYLPGSLKEVVLGEAWETRDNEQRGLYTSNGIGLSGNYLNVKVYSPEEEGKDLKEGGIYVVYDYNAKPTDKRDYPETHYSVIRYTEHNGQNAPTIENVKFIGNTQRTENTAIPAGIMTMCSRIQSVTVKNVIARNFFTNVVYEKEYVSTDSRSSLNIDKSKFYDSFSNMVFSWHSDTINVTESEMIGAGGPVIILEMEAGSEYGGTLNVDGNSFLESKVTGYEAWFSINKVPGTLIESLNGLLGLTADFGLSYTEKRTVGGVEREYMNVIAAAIPAPGDIFNNTYDVKGDISIGGADYSLHNDTMFRNIINANPSMGSGILPVLAGGSTNTAANYNYAYTADLATLTNPFSAAGLTDEMWKESWRTTSTDTLGLYINPGAMSQTPNFNVKHFLLVVGKTQQTAA